MCVYASECVAVMLVDKPEGQTLSFSWHSSFLCYAPQSWNKHTKTDANSPWIYFLLSQSLLHISRRMWLMTAPHFMTLQLILLLPFQSQWTCQGSFLLSRGTARPGTLIPPTHLLYLTTVRGIWNLNKTKCLFLLLDLFENAFFNISILGQRVQVKF